MILMSSDTCLPWSQLFTSRWITAVSLHRKAAAYTALTWDCALFLTFRHHLYSGNLQQGVSTVQTPHFTNLLLQPASASQY